MSVKSVKSTGESTIFNILGTDNLTSCNLTGLIAKWACDVSDSDYEQSIVGSFDIVGRLDSLPK